MSVDIVMEIDSAVHGAADLAVEPAVVILDGGFGLGVDRLEIDHGDVAAALVVCGKQAGVQLVVTVGESAAGDGELCGILARGGVSDEVGGFSICLGSGADIQRGDVVAIRRSYRVVAVKELAESGFAGGILPGEAGLNAEIAVLLFSSVVVAVDIYAGVQLYIVPLGVDVVSARAGGHRACELNCEQADQNQTEQYFNCLLHKNHLKKFLLN